MHPEGRVDHRMGGLEQLPFSLCGLMSSVFTCGFQRVFEHILQTCQRGWDSDMMCKMRLCMYLPEGVGFWYDVQDETVHVLARGGGILIWCARWDCACTCQRGWDFDMTWKMRLVHVLARGGGILIWCVRWDWCMYLPEGVGFWYDVEDETVHVLARGGGILIWCVRWDCACTCQRGWDFEISCKMRLCMYLPEGVGFWYDVEDETVHVLARGGGFWLLSRSCWSES